MAKKSLQSVLLWIHRWFGIIIGLHFMLMGLTGGYLLFGVALENLQNPQIRMAKVEAPRYDLARIVESAVIGMNSQVFPSRINIPEHPGENIVLNFNVAKPDEKARVEQAFVDPSDSTFAGRQNPRELVRDLMLRYHEELFLDEDLGHVVIAVMGCLLLVLLLSGLYLWWPKTRFLGRSLKLPRLRGVYQSFYELHKFLGFYTLALLLMMAVSGIYIAKPQWFEGRDREKAEVAGKPAQKRGASLPVSTAIDFAKLQSDLDGMGVPPRRLLFNVNAGTMQIEVRSLVMGIPERNFVFDINTSELSGVESRVKPFALRPFLHDLHEGKFWSWTGRYIVLIATPMTLFLFVSGVWIWWKRPSRRRGGHSA